MKKTIISTTLILLSCIILSAQKGAFKIAPLIGVRLFDDKSIGAISRAQKAKVLTALTIGIEVSHHKTPLALSFQRDYWASMYPFNAIDSIFPSNPSLIFSSRRIDHIILSYQRGKSTYGLGHYWQTFENVGHHLRLASLKKHKGFELVYSHSFHWVDIEYRRRINYSPGFDLIGSSLGSLHFLYRIGRKPNTANENSKINKAITVNGILGSRFYHPKGIEIISGERLDKIIVAPLAGIEFLWKKHHISFNIEKDIWIGVNSGSFTRNLKGYIDNTSIGFKYHHELNRGHHIRYGLTATWIDDYQNERARRGTSYYNGLRYSDFGVGANISYELVKNWDIEMKHTFTLADDNNSPFTIRRLSLGLIYRFNPFRD